MFSLVLIFFSRKFLVLIEYYDGDMESMIYFRLWLESLNIDFSCNSLFVFFMLLEMLFNELIICGDVICNFDRILW